MSKTRSLSAIFLVTLLVIFTSATREQNGLDEDVLKYTNQFRKSKGMSPLTMRTDLSDIARKHSQEMASGKRSFGHGGYSQREQKVKKLITPYNGMAENVAYGAASGKDAVSVWKNSSGHRKNMLGNYKYIGIGTARNKRGIIYYTQIFVK